MKNNGAILLVEDDRVDAMTVRRALKELNVRNPLFEVGNGEEALAFLRDTQKPRPSIILLDLNMPKMNGIEFLQIAKNDPVLRQIPVVVLTTSKADQDRFDSYSMSVAGYMVKPVDYMKFVETIKTIRLYWTLCELP